jgi:DNA ligase (NAD+)
MGPVVGAQVRAFFARPETASTARRLEREVKPLSPPRSEAATANPLAGLGVVFTGTLFTMTRPQAEALVRELGGKAVSNVSVQTGLVVIGENPGSKADRARALEVRMVDETGFLSLAAQAQTNASPDPAAQTTGPPSQPVSGIRNKDETS